MHCFVQVPAIHENHSLVAETRLQPGRVSQFAVRPFYFLEEPHRPVQLPAVHENHSLVVEASLQVPSITRLAVMFNEATLQRRRLCRVAHVSQQNCKCRYIFPPVPRWIIQNRLVSAGHAEVGVCLDASPVSFDLNVRGLPSGRQKREVRQEVAQALPGSRLGQLPGQLVDPAAAEVPGLEIVGQAQMRGLLRRLIGQIAAADCLAEIVVEEADQPGAND